MISTPSSALVHAKPCLVAKRAFPKGKGIARKSNGPSLEPQDQFTDPQSWQIVTTSQLSAWLHPSRNILEAQRIISTKYAAGLPAEIVQSMPFSNLAAPTRSIDIVSNSHIPPSSNGTSVVRGVHVTFVHHTNSMHSPSIARRTEF